MKNRYTLQKWAFGFCFLFSVFSFNVFGQVGIGTTDPNPNALLDIDASTTPGGLLLPRVNLTATNLAAPLASNVPGMVVYNTAVAGVAPNAVTPGYYYNDGSQWVRVADASTPSNDWSRSGNVGTVPGTGVGQNYLGTSDGEDLVIATTGAERMRFLANGQVVVNYTAAPVAGDRFTVQGADTERAINGNTSNSTGVYGFNSAGIGNGVFGNSSNVGVRGFGGNGAILESGLDSGYGTIAWNTTASGDFRTGLLVLGQNLTPISFENTGAILYGNLSGGVGFTSNGNGTGFQASGNASTTSFTLNAGSGLAGTGADIGVFGLATNTASLPNLVIGKAGGYFANMEGGYAYVGAWADPMGGGNNADISYKIIGTGTVSTIVKDVNDTPITMFAPEAPEILFQDYGIGKLNNGTAIINLDPNLTKNIRVDDNHPLKVFVQLEGDCNGVYVTNKSANSFTVKELQNGNSNVPFSWSIVATRADEVFYNSRGEAKVSHNGQRFPLAPKALEIIETKANQASAGPVETKILKASQLSSAKVSSVQAVQNDTKNTVSSENNTTAIQNSPSSQTNTSSVSPSKNNVLGVEGNK